MKKLLTSMLVLAMGATCVAGLAACTNGGETKSDAEIAKDAIQSVRSMYSNADTVTPVDYQLLGQTKVGNELYTINWSVSSDTFENVSDYVVPGTEMDANSKITVSVTKAPGVEIEYTLTASVTVGKATESADFERTVPAGIDRGEEETKTVSLDFGSTANRTTLDEDGGVQVWEQNGVTFTNNGNVANYFNPVRLYKNTTVTVEVDNADILHIDFHSAQGYDDSPYPDYLKESLEASELPIKEITVSEDKLTIGVEFESALESVTFKTTAGQCRLTSIDVEVLTRPEGAHVHNWTYTHVAGTWTHTATCTAEGCDLEEGKTENCTPVLNTCACGYEYTAAEIVNALFALENGKSLPGTYQLTGLITVVTEVSTSYGNSTFTMTVEGKDVVVFRAKGTYYADVAVGDTATVTGELLDYSGTKEFTQGCSVVGLVKGDGTIPNPNPNPDPDIEIVHAGTKEDPYTTAEALAIAKSLASGAYTDDIVYVEGYVVTVGSWNSGYSNWTNTKLASSADGSATDADAFTVYRLLVDGTFLTAQDDLVAGSYIVVEGHLQNYQGNSPQMTYKGDHTPVAVAYTKAEVTTPEPSEGESVLYTLTTSTSGSNNGYASDCDVTVGGIVWNIEGNSTMDPWRFGGKSITDQDRNLTGKTAISGTVTKIVVVFGASNITVNSVTLKVYTVDPTTDGAAPAYTRTLSHSANGTVTVEAGDEDWTNCYFQVTFNVTETSGSNKYVTISTMTFYGNGGSTENNPGTTPGEGEVDPTEESVIYTLTTSTSGSNNGYASDCDVTVDGVVWNIEGNSTMNPWRFGGKSITDQDRNLTGKTAISGKVTKVVIAFGASNITVNSVTLKVYKVDPTTEGATAAYTRTLEYSADGTITVEAGDEDWTNCYFQVTFNVTETSGSNKYVTISTMTFWGYKD